MTMKLRNNEEINIAFVRLINQMSEQEKLENQANLLMFRFLSHIEIRCKQLGWNRKQLAQKTGTSASYITQLFRGDKMVNLTLLAKFQEVLGIEFEISAKLVSSDSVEREKIGTLGNDLLIKDIPVPENIAGEPSSGYEESKSEKKNSKKRQNGVI